MSSSMSTWSRVVWKERGREEEEERREESRGRLINVQINAAAVHVCISFTHIRIHIPTLFGHEKDGLLDVVFSLN